MYPLHSHVTLEEQSNVFLATVPGYRKVNTIASFFIKWVKPFAEVIIANNNVYKFMLALPAQTVV